MVVSDPRAELAAIMLERRRLVRVVLWTLVATAATMLLALATLLG